MIINKPDELLVAHRTKKQRLGNKTLFTNLIKNNNNTEVRYFSGIDAEIYFDSIFIDETTSIEFSIAQNTLPIYGYNSYIYDDIALGNRLIKGEFSINFTQASYMYAVLNTLSKVKNDSITDINSNSPLWNKTFSIFLSYGDNRQGGVAGSTILQLKEVSLTSCSQNFSSTGEPIEEVYEFVARDVSFLSESEYESKTEVSERDTEPIKSVTCALSADNLEVSFEAGNNIDIESLMFKVDQNSYYNDVFSQDEKEEGAKVFTFILSDFTLVEDKIDIEVISEYNEVDSPGDQMSATQYFSIAPK